jgi:hypothetical protein
VALRDVRLSGRWGGGIGAWSLAALLTAIALHADPAIANDTYWSYSYGDVNVTSAVGAERAHRIAHDLRRLDLAIGIALGATAQESRPKTGVYVVPQSTFDILYGKSKNISAIYLPDTYGGTILINSSLDRDEPLFDVYFGYAAALIGQGYATRHPPWFLMGLTQVFAASKIDRKDVILGNIDSGRILPLRQKWIPLDTFFALRWSDPQFADIEFRRLYDAEAWFIVHEIFLERWRIENFGHYFQRLDGGDDEKQAFAASFEVSYEALRKELEKAESARMNMVRIAVPDEDDRTAPRRLSDGEALGRLALVASRTGADLPGNLKLAKDAAALDPGNQDAFAATARTEFRLHDLPAALKSTEEACALPALRPDIAYLCGTFYTDLYMSDASRNGQLATPRSELADKADRFFEASLERSPIDPAAWEGLSRLLAASQDVQKATAVLPRAKHAWAQREQDARLAGAVSSLCAMSRDYDSAVKFAIVAQKYALTNGDAQAAAAYLARLRSFVERKDAVAPAPPTAEAAVDNH